MYYTYKNSILIGTIGGILTGTFFARVKYHIEKYNITTFKSEVIDNIQYLKDNIRFDYKNCPKTNFHLKSDLYEYYNLLKSPLKEQDEDYKARLEQYICYRYNKLSAKPTAITSSQVMDEVKKTFELIQSTIIENSDPTLLVLGENHLSQESFLLEALILTYLKQHNLSNSFLIERAPNYDNNTALNKFNDINPIHFAQHVLRYNLVGIDPYNEDHQVLSYKREKAMGDSVYNHLLKSSDKVIVVAVGLAHLPFFKDYTAVMHVNVLLLKLATFGHKVIEEEFSAEFLETFNSLNGIRLDQSIEAMSFQQILDIYTDCLENDFNGTDTIYISKSYQECSDIQFNFCGLQNLEEGNLS